MMHPIVLAITGASGAIYGVRLLEVLLAAGRTVYLSISPSGKTVLKEELEIKIDLEKFSVESLFRNGEQGTLTPALSQGEREKYCCYCHFQDLMSPVASGSFLTGGMVI